MTKEPRYIKKEERDYLESKKVLPDPKTKKCEGCQKIFFEIQLARFGRHAGSPWLCETCAKHEFERLRKKAGVSIEQEMPKGTIETE